VCDRAAATGWQSLSHWHCVDADALRGTQSGTGQLTTSELPGPAVAKKKYLEFAHLRRSIPGTVHSISLFKFCLASTVDTSRRLSVSYTNKAAVIGAWYGAEVTCNAGVTSLVAI